MSQRNISRAAVTLQHRLLRETMALSFFFKGLALGFSIAAPVGPIGVLCIRRSLASGIPAGFAVGLGAATADAAYGCIAGFGLTAVSSFLVGQQFWLGVLGGVFLCYLGVRTFASRPAANAAEARGDGLFTAYISTLFLTLTHPLTIASFVAAFAAFGVGSSPDYLAACALVSGVFMGSAIWWLILSGGVGWLRSRVTLTWMQALNRFSGSVLFVFGLCALARVLFKLFM